MRYYYCGPIYRFQYTPVEEIEFYTEATSKAQAINNFKAKAKKYLGLAMTAKVDIKVDNVVPADDFDDFDPFEQPKETKRCEICGRQLNDAGECPTCDLGDEEIYEDINRLDDTSQLITDIMKTRFSSGAGIIRSYLLPDGTFLSTDYRDKKYGEGKDYRPHFTFENFLGNFVFGYLGKQYDSWNNYDEEEKEKVRREYGIDDKDIQKIYDYIDENYGWENIGEKADQAGCPFFENELGWIRLNGGVDGEKYMVIPSRDTTSNLTPQQYRGLEKWLDRFFIDEMTLTLPDSAWDWDEVKYSTGNESDTVDYIIQKIRKYYNTGKLTESKTNLTEATRNDLISKSRNADQYKNGGNRWLQKSKCSVANAVKDYNKIDMDTFWKKDQLSFGVKVAGETDSYLVTIQLNKILEKLEREVRANKNKLDPKIIYRALFQAMNGGDVLINCSCPDFRYRLAYHASKNDYKAGEKETRAANMTNPNDTKGAACKHILMVLNNLEWLNKIASVINNYINYCKDNMEYNYSRYMFPKIYGMPYQKAVQMVMDDYDENGEIKDTLKSDEATINLANALGAVRGRIQKGSNKNPVAQANKQQEK